MTASAKLRDLAHLAVREFGDVPYRPGDALLRDALWRADAGAFRKLGRPISGAAWVKRGGAPAPEGLDEALDALALEGRIAVRERSGPDGGRTFVPLAEPDPRALAAEEQRIASDAVAAALGAPAEDYSAIADAAQEGEEIPIGAVLAARSGEVTPEARARAEASAARAGVAA